METKAQIRKSLMQKRDRISVDEAITASAELKERLTMQDFIQNHGYFYAYYPLGRELSLLPFLQWLIDAGKRVALPKVNGDTMDFYEITSLEDVKKGCFGVMEPLGVQKVNWEEAVCLTPGVGFSKNGQRIGHGAGYYDKYFAKHPRLEKVGVAYDFQIEEIIPTEETDVTMDWMVTPSYCEMTEHNCSK